MLDADALPLDVETEDAAIAGSGLELFMKGGGRV